MPKYFHHSRIRKNHLGIHKDPHSAFIAGVDLKASAEPHGHERMDQNSMAMTELIGLKHVMHWKKLLITLTSRQTTRPV